jgi:plasmid stabilization system protein ParE
VKVVWAPLAEARVAEAFAFLAADRPSAAANWLERVLNRVAQLARFPDSGRPVRVVGRPDIREVPVRPYRLIYRRDPARVIVLTVRHMRQDWDPREISEA